MATPRKRIPRALRLYGVDDVARALGVSSRLVMQMRKRGALIGYWIAPHTWRIEHRDLVRFVRSQPKVCQSRWNDMSKAREAQARQLAARLNLIQVNQGSAESQAA